MKISEEFSRETEMKMQRPCAESEPGIRNIRRPVWLKQNEMGGRGEW